MDLKSYSISPRKRAIALGNRFRPKLQRGLAIDERHSITVRKKFPEWGLKPQEHLFHNLSSLPDCLTLLLCSRRSEVKCLIRCVHDSPPWTQSKGPQRPSSCYRKLICTCTATRNGLQYLAHCLHAYVQLEKLFGRSPLSTVGANRSDVYSSLFSPFRKLLLKREDLSTQKPKKSLLTAAEVTLTYRRTILTRPCSAQVKTLGENREFAGFTFLRG